MSDGKVLLNCYNRGCGQKFNPDENNDDACSHHPGMPVFHDAYKGWSCCDKKCTDFTEFLNIKGCTKSRHSDVKPQEPAKREADEAILKQSIEIRPPMDAAPTLERPPFDGPMITVKPTVSPALLEQIQGLTNSAKRGTDKGEISIGTTCGNNSCDAIYRGPEFEEGTCEHHPGQPIFHEGMKYWSCCKKKTSDFTTFLGQPGCAQGSHVWQTKKTNAPMQCRMDWHQTGSHVVVSIYAKKYDPGQSWVRLNPVRLCVNLFFVEENSRYKFDVELRGIVDVEQCSASMLPTKVEIKLKKAEIGSWTNLDFPRKSIEESKTRPVESNEDTISARVDAVDLDDL